MSEPKKRGDKWRLRSFVGVDSNGNKIYKSFTCDTAAACKRAEKAWLKAGGKVELKKPAGPTVEEALNDYIEACKHSRRKNYSPATIDGYKKIVRNNYGTMLTMQADKVTVEDLQNLIDTLCDEGKSLKSIKNAVYLLKPALDLKKVLINYNSLEFPEQEQKDYIIPTDQEVTALLDATRNDPDLYIAIVLAAFLGLRRSEICALTYGDIDRTEMVVRVNKAVVMDDENIYQVKETKTRAGKRSIDIDETILNTLLIKQKQAGIIYTPDVKLIDLTPAALTSKWNRLKAKQHFEFCFHGLRHYSASVMVALDLPQKYVIERMGHATPDMVNRVYAQIIKEKERKVSDAINAHTNAVLTGTDYSWK